MNSENCSNGGAARVKTRALAFSTRVKAHVREDLNSENCSPAVKIAWQWRCRTSENSCFGFSTRVKARVRKESMGVDST